MTVPDYTTHADSLFDAGQPILGATGLEARDNLISVAGGGVDAPRIDLLALQRLTAGDEIRSRADGFTLSPSTNEIVTLLSFGFIQSGTIRCIVQRTAGVGANASMQVSRVRGGATTVIVGVTASDISADVSVRNGDEILLQGQRDASQSRTYNARLATDGGDLWFAGLGHVEGNSDA